MSKITYLKPGLSLLASLVVALGIMTVTSPAAQAYDRSETVTKCIDGANHLGQMYVVDCGLVQGFESDDVCQTNADRTVTCTVQPGVDSNTLCLYQYDHFVKQPGSTSPFREFTAYENGPCQARGDVIDPSPYCTSFLQYFNGGSTYVLDATCPEFDGPTGPDDPGNNPDDPNDNNPGGNNGKKRLAVRLTFLNLGTLNPRHSKVRVSAQGRQGAPWAGIFLDVCDRDRVTKARRCSTLRTDSAGRVEYPVANPTHGLNISVSHLGTNRTKTATAARDYNVRTVTKGRVVQRRKLVVTSYPRVATVFKVQRRTAHGWKVVRKVTSGAAGKATIKKLPQGRYRVHAAGAQGRLPDHSNSVTIRTRRSSFRSLERFGLR